MLTSLPFTDSFAPWVREANLAGPSWSLGKSTPSKAYTTTNHVKKLILALLVEKRASQIWKL